MLFILWYGGHSVELSMKAVEWPGEIPVIVMRTKRVKTNIRKFKILRHVLWSGKNESFDFVYNALESIIMQY